jgi:hypothetical protein
MRRFGKKTESVLPYAEESELLSSGLRNADPNLPSEENYFHAVSSPDEPTKEAEPVEGKAAGNLASYPPLPLAKTDWKEALDKENDKKLPGKEGKNRTRGLYIFDVFLYPILTNFAVFAVSVYATYQTTYGKPGNWLKERGDVFRKGMKQKLGFSDSTAKMATMVLFSFLDGSLMAPVVKFFEDRRGKIARWIDDRLGTTPEDTSVYDEEPKQSWWSVLGGRFATVMIVVPTAVLLDQKSGGNQSWNDRLFSEPGKKTGEWVEKNVPAVQKAFPKLNIPGIMEIAFFEAFYTSVCTAGLYISSRFFAGKSKEKEEAKATVNLTTEPVKVDKIEKQVKFAIHQPQSFVSSSASAVSAKKQTSDVSEDKHGSQEAIQYQPKPGELAASLVQPLNLQAAQAPARDLPASRREPSHREQVTTQRLNLAPALG